MKTEQLQEKELQNDEGIGLWLLNRFFSKGTGSETRIHPTSLHYGWKNHVRNWMLGFKFCRWMQHLYLCSPAWSHWLQLNCLWCPKAKVSWLGICSDDVFDILCVMFFLPLELCRWNMVLFISPVIFKWAQFAQTYFIKAES